MGLYAAIPLADKLSLTPNISYFIDGDAIANKNGVTKDHSFGASVDIRFVFEPIYAHLRKIG